MALYMFSNLTSWTHQKNRLIGKSYVNDHVAYIVIKKYFIYETRQYSKIINRLSKRLKTSSKIWNREKGESAYYKPRASSKLVWSTIFCR